MYRVAIISEGPSDYAILLAIIDSYFDDYVPVPIQPPISCLGGHSGDFGGGWRGVKSWCESEVRTKSSHSLTGLTGYDLVIIHIDADVAHEEDIDCASTCPPAETTCEAIRSVLHGWTGWTSLPPKTIFCIPAQATETWALSCLFPGAPEMNKSQSSADWIECRNDIKDLVRHYCSGYRPKLVVMQSGRLKNQAKGYAARSLEIAEGWEATAKLLPSACRFANDLRPLLPPSALLR